MTLIAAIQTTSGDDIERNLDVIAGFVEAAKSEGAQLVVLPECFALMPKNSGQLRRSAEVHGEGKIQDFMAQLSRRVKLWIIAGSLPLRSDDAARVFNSLLVYDDNGANVARYDKIHLFDVELSGGEHYRESDYTMPGGECVVQDTPAGAVGLTVCYDLRFPEMYRRLSAMGATCMVVPSAFTVSTGIAHWAPLLRARAIENCCYVIAPAQVGIHGSGRQTYGHSLIIDPWGEIIAQRKTDPGLLFAEIDREKLERIRSQLPCLSHRRPDLFDPACLTRPVRPDRFA